MNDLFITARIPYDKSLSKNRMKWLRQYKGRMVICASNEYKDAKDNVIALIQRAVGDKKFVDKQKVWISILMVKNNMRSDAINFIDGLCDAIKVAINVDDKWFSIKIVDWMYDKEQPPHWWVTVEQ